MLMDEIFYADNIEMERELVHGMDQQNRLHMLRAYCTTVIPSM